MVTKHTPNWNTNSKISVCSVAVCPCTVCPRDSSTWQVHMATRDTSSRWLTVLSTRRAKVHIYFNFPLKHNPSALQHNLFLSYICTIFLVSIQMQQQDPFSHSQEIYFKILMKNQVAQCLTESGSRFKGGKGKGERIMYPFQLVIWSIYMQKASRCYYMIPLRSPPFTSVYFIRRNFRTSNVQFDSQLTFFHQIHFE